MFKLCIFVESCFSFNSYKHYNCHLTAQCSLEQFDRLLHKWHNDVYWMPDFLLKTHWNVTYIKCQFTAQCSPTYIILCYVNDTTTRRTCWPSLWVTWHWMLQTLQCHFAAQCNPNYISFRYVNDTTTRPTCRVSLWRLTRKAKLSSPWTRLQQRLNPESPSTGFPIFLLPILSAVFLFFCCCCLSVQKLDLSTWSWLRFMCPDYFSSLITTKVSGEWVGLIYLTDHAFVLCLQHF
jgi:hypothetical protein